MNNNGEAGTIAANDYIKGDSAFLYVIPAPEGESLSSTSKALVQKILLKCNTCLLGIYLNNYNVALSQKGDPVESFKVGQVTAGARGSDGTPYVIAEISYQLNTEAGFLIARKGYASLTQVGPNIQSLVALSTTQRFKNGIGEKLKDIVDSFRVYKLNSGIFSGAGKTPETKTDVIAPSASQK